MATFYNLFGIHKEDIKKTCVLSPFLYKGLLNDLGIKKLNRGARFSAAHTNNITLIHTHISALQVGDCVLNLKDAPCQHIVLYGTCGNVQTTQFLDIGTIVTPQKSYNFESFSHLLNNTTAESQYTYTSKNLLQAINKTIVTCASFGSVDLEKNYLEKLTQLKIDVVDMETSAFYSACQYIKISGIALLYVSDFIEKTNVFDKKNTSESSRINEAQKECLKIINTLSINT